jgi:DNA-binding GntR family transcriptional regulator
MTESQTGPETEKQTFDTAEDVYLQLCWAITDQRLRPGVKLTELALVEALGASRRNVRDALARLAWDELVTLLPNRGAYVSSPTASQAAQVFEARLAIEAGTTEAVARAADPDAMAQLTNILAQERKHREKGELRKAIHLSGGFHVLMADLSGNPIFARQVKLLVTRTSLIVDLYGNRGGLTCWHDHHDELIEHCANGEVETAVALMRQHICEIRDGLVLDQQAPIGIDLNSLLSS